MLVLMKDSFKHRGTYPFYTLALSKRTTESLDIERIPLIIRQYGPSDIIVETYGSVTDAYDVFKLFVGEEQPFIPALERVH